MRRFLGLFFLIVAFTPCTLLGQQQNQSATINLNVTDPSGAVVPQARAFVLLVPMPDDPILVTDQAGNLSLTLAPGHYSLTVEQQGFKTYKQELEAKAGSRQTISIILEIGTGLRISMFDALPMMFPDQTMGLSPDGRYALRREEKSGHHIVKVEDLHRKTWRILMQYHQHVIFRWSGTQILATDYLENHSSRCFIYLADKKIRPISVSDLLKSQLEEDERHGLEDVLINKHVELDGHWEQGGGGGVRVDAYGANGILEFRWSYDLKVPPA